MVPTVLEKAMSILSGDRRDRRSDGLQERLSSSGLAFSKEALDLGVGFFDRIEVRRVGRQVQKLTTPPFDELSYPTSFVSREVVHHHDLACAQRGSSRTCST
jgi:hypothetical protein